MNIKKHTYIILSALAFTACSHDDNSAPTYTVGDADNAIVLSAGIAEGPSGVSSRGAEANHSKHVAFKQGTKLALKVIGDWWKQGADAAAEIAKTTTATIGAETVTDSKHNPLSMSPQLYWDDYGTADPANIDAPDGTAVSGTGGRGKGLTIYAAAVDGKTDEAPTIDGTTGNTWTALSWTLDADQKTYDWKNKDLLISNNVKDGTDDGTYKFDTNPRTKLLEFKHAMSKITFRLIANEGFPTTEGVGNTAHRFANTPEVILTSNETGQSNTEWANTTCNVNVETGAVTTPTVPAKITMHAQATPANTYTAIYDALVVPGSQFGAPTTVDEKDVFPIIARINADGNIYYVTSEKIRTAIQTAITAGTHADSYTTQSGKNYIFNITVNKTKIDVTATIKDWEDVEADEVTPVINVSASYGNSSGTALGKAAFSFYRSTSLNNGYSAGIALVNGFVPSEAVVTAQGSPATTWVFTDGNSNPKPLYWSDHNTHYQMRGVWPLTSTATGATTSPRVKASTTNSGYQVIEVSNVAYTAETFPSDLAIGRPNVTEEQTCSNSDHDPQNLYTVGICATEGTVNLDFEYMMSQVEVNLSTTTSTDAVNLNNAKVEVTNLYTKGEIKLGDRGSIVTGEKGLYTLHSTSTANQFKDAIVPQTLTYSTDVAQKENNVRFKITIYKNGDTNQIDDIYYADVNPILKSGSTEKVAPNGKWERGKRYVYYLKLAKTKIDVTATFKNWDEVEASENVWF